VFRQKLLEAISRKDARFLLSIIDPNIQISFGGEEGIQAFRELWKPEDVNSEIWNTLAQLLRLGGTFGESRNEFWAPYVFSRFPDDYGGFDFSAIIAKDVRVSSEPNDKAPMITSLSYDIVLNVSGTDSPEPKTRRTLSGFAFVFQTVGRVLLARNLFEARQITGAVSKRPVESGCSRI
jgi:hypothetical protein